VQALDVNLTVGVLERELVTIQPTVTRKKPYHPLGVVELDNPAVEDAISNECVFRRKRTLIPSESEQRFQWKANTDSDSFRTVIPTRIEHGVRWVELSCF
jgi:hypothetical protein